MSSAPLADWRPPPSWYQPLEVTSPQIQRAPTTMPQGQPLGMPVQGQNSRPGAEMTASQPSIPTQAAALWQSSSASASQMTASQQSAPSVNQRASDARGPPLLEPPVSRLGVPRSQLLGSALDPNDEPEPTYATIEGMSPSDMLGRVRR